MSGPPAKQAKTPQPTPRTRTAALPRISTPGTKTSSKASVPKPSQDPRGRSPHVFGPQRVLLQSPAARPSPAARQQTPARGPALVSAANRKSAPAAVTSVVTAADSEDDDWSSDISELQEMDPKRLQAYQQPNAIAADKRLPAKRVPSRSPRLRKPNIQERRLAAAGGEHERLEEKVRALTEELNHLMNCPHCDKSFINSSFLQNHLQRCHPDEFEMQQSRSDSEKKSQLDVLKAEISSLKEELGQQTLLAKEAQEKELETLHRELDRFKAEEIERTDRKIEDSRDGIRQEMEFLYTRNFQSRIYLPKSCQKTNEVKVYLPMQSTCLYTPVSIVLLINVMEDTENSWKPVHK
ncbi:hypothetical protein NHX12_016172, partial [Muraenolepis orangiensis]